MEGSAVVLFHIPLIRISAGRIDILRPVDLGIIEGGGAGIIGLPTAGQVHELIARAGRIQRSGASRDIIHHLSFRLGAGGAAGRCGGAGDAGTGGPVEDIIRKITHVRIGQLNSSGEAVGSARGAEITLSRKRAGEGEKGVSAGGNRHPLAGRIKTDIATVQTGQIICNGADRSSTFVGRDVIARSENGIRTGITRRDDSEHVVGDGAGAGTVKIGADAGTDRTEGRVNMSKHQHGAEAGAIRALRIGKEPGALRFRRAIRGADSSRDCAVGTAFGGGEHEDSAKNKADKKNR